MAFFKADLRLWPVSGVNHGVFREGEKLVFQTIHQLTGVSSGKVAAPHATVK